MQTTINAGGHSVSLSTASITAAAAPGRLAAAQLQSDAAGRT